MSDTSMQSDLLGLLFGLAPGMLLGVIGLVLGGEWAWNLGFVAMWLILFGLFAGPLMGWVGPEIVAERPAVTGALIGLVPGVFYAVLRFDEAGWLVVLLMLLGSMAGGLVGHRVFDPRKSEPLPPLGRRPPAGLDH
jgi:hypothetical protein